jgi:DNA-binding HxlR family transcriptional regulator
MTVLKNEGVHSFETCTSLIVPVRDALEILNGRWKLPIIISIIFGPKRFSQISKEVNGVTDKVLSKALKELELNQLITRTVHDTFPPTVEYAITEHGKSLEKLISELRTWGMSHRKKIMNK